MLRLILTVFFLACVCLAQEHHHLKIAEKLAIPHHIRHAYDYPALNFQGATGNRVGQRQAFSQPDPFNQPQPQPQDPSSFRSFSSTPNRNAPARQTRFFNLYTPNTRPDFGLSRRQS